MRKVFDLRNLAVIGLLFAIFSCSTDEVDSAEENNLIGTVWKYTDTATNGLDYLITITSDNQAEFGGGSIDGSSFTYERNGNELLFDFVDDGILPAELKGNILSLVVDQGPEDFEEWGYIKQ
jgi:hypothetical protein